MNRYLCALLLFAVVCLAGCALPANKNSTDSTKKKAETAIVPLKTEEVKSQAANSDINMAASIAVPVKQEKSENKTDEKKLRITLYYQDSEGIIIPVTRQIERQQAIAKTAIYALIDNSIIREELDFYGIYPTLPIGTEILGLSIKQGTATIDFNNKVLDYKDAVGEKNIITSVVYTLTEFENVNNVRILINGKSQTKLKFGTDISKPLNRQNVLINSERVNVQGQKSKLDVYLYKNESKNMFIIPVSVECENVNLEDIPAQIIANSTGEYLGGKVHSQLPEHSKLIKSSIKDGLLTLDFSSQFKKYGGTAREDAILKQLQYSAKQIKGVKSIKVLIEGKADALPEGTETANGLKIPEEINYIED